MKSWTEEEIAYLIKNYPKNNLEKMVKDLGRNKNSIKLKATRIGLRVKVAHNRKYWTEKEMRYLEKNWGKVDVEIMSKKLKRSTHSIYTKAMRTWGIMKNQEYTSRDLANALNINSSSVMTYVKMGLKSTKLKRYRMIDINDFWEFAKEHKKTVKFHRFEKNSIPNEPTWVEEERRKQFKNLEKNHWKEWSNYEDIILINFVKRGKTTREIAREMKRSHNSIQTRRSILNVNFIIEMEKSKNAV